MMRTLTELFEQSVEQFPDNTLLWEKKTKEYEGTTYAEAHKQVHYFGAGLMSLGIQKGDRIGLLAEGQNAWLISELGILYAGGINVPLSIKLEAQTELKFRLEHSGARMIIVSRNQASKVEEIRDQLPLLEKVIYIDGKENPSEKDLEYVQVMSMGKTFLRENKSSFDKVWKNIKDNDPANISYTSGTTADPKGIILSHLNYAANVAQANSLMNIPASYKTLAILPWDHSFAHTACLYSFMVNGASIGSVQIGRNSLDTLKNVPGNIKEFKPHMLMSVPALAKNFRKNIEASIRKQGTKAERLFNHALKVTYAYNGIGWDRGRGLRIFLKPLVALYDKILFSKIRDGFGGNLQLFIGGGALLDIELQRFFYAIGTPMCQGYGLSEASPVISSNALHAVKFGTSGRLVDNLQLRILDENGNELPKGQKGEIVIKGDNVMLGYWKNEQATNETLKDGWLHTGDMGFLDKDNFLHVLGRFKSLLIGNDGEKFSPEGIEEALIDQSPYIDQVMLFNNQNPFTVGLIVPNIGAINRKLEERSIKPGTDEAIDAALHLIRKEVNEYLKGGKFEGEFPERWLPSNIAVLPEAFTEQNHLLNSTMKMVRNKVTSYFADQLDYLYTPEAKNICNPKNQEGLKAWYK
ncbi:long-chain fatty acid--CoA ligase [Puteibacter caeruleilacunae]|nr:long-chain fatty acid--CoA ligase [Puteibacter caeruleilacunae]